MNTFGFEHALWLVKAGHKVSREGWNRRNTKFLRLRPPSNGTVSYIELVYLPGERYPEGITAPWSPTRCDLLEDDWYQA
jgi:hypothetical protein